MIYYANEQSPYIQHYGVLGMRWGHRKAKANYKSTGIRSAIARASNAKVDASFDIWNEKVKRKNTAIDLGKKANLSKIAYEKNKKNKDLKIKYNEDNKNYKKALRKNNTYNKGKVKREVGIDLGRKYLSEAKRIKKQIDNSTGDTKQLQKQYNKLMSKHDIVRASARHAKNVGVNRAALKSGIKRTLTATAATVAVGTGLAAANKYLSSHKVTLNGKPVFITQQTLQNVSNFINTGKTIFGLI